MHKTSNGHVNCVNGNASHKKSANLLKVEALNGGLDNGQGAHGDINGVVSFDGPFDIMPLDENGNALAQDVVVLSPASLSASHSITASSATAATNSPSASGHGQMSLSMDSGSYYHPTSTAASSLGDGSFWSGGRTVEDGYGDLAWDEV